MPGLFRRHAPAQIGLDRHFQMRAQLVIEVALHAAAREKPAEARAENAKAGHGTLL